MEIIKRKRYVIIRNDGQILCTTAGRCFCKPISSIGEAQIKTFSSEKRAKLSLARSWRKEKADDYKVVAVEEAISILETATGKSPALSCLSAFEAFCEGFERGVNQKHGHWVSDRHGFICSQCKEYNYFPHKYCPDCGAIMDEEAEDDEL